MAKTEKSGKLEDREKELVSKVIAVDSRSGGAWERNNSKKVGWHCGCLSVVFPRRLIQIWHLSF